MSLGDSEDKALLLSDISSLRIIHSINTNEALPYRLVVERGGKASAAYSKLTLATVSQLISTLTFSLELRVNTRFCKGTPNPKNSEYRLANPL